jgi:hypothetical protein
MSILHPASRANRRAASPRLALTAAALGQAEGPVPRVSVVVCD